MTPGYFRTLGIALAAGRAFEERDIVGGLQVAIVNEAFARQYFPGENAIGRRIEVGRPGAGQAAEIVGIVADIKEASLRAEPRRTIYVPQAQA